MRAVLVRSFGGPEVLELACVDRPPLAAGHVRVALRAAGVNRADVLLRTGAYHGAEPPARPGLEAAGVVTELPAGASYAVGDRVLLFADRSGLYATEACPSERAICPIPDGVGFAEAAALPINWLTAYYCVRELIGIERGEDLLVLAAASGVGTAAVQIAARQGARVLAAASAPEKLDLARRLGAAEAIDYRSEDLVQETLRLTGSKGADGVLDAVGGRRFAQALKALAPFGRVAQLANVTLEDSAINTRDFYPKNARIFGFQLGKLLASGRWDPAPAMRAILAEVASGHYRPVIDSTFPLARAADAHRHLESRAARGKIVLTIDEGDGDGGG